MDYQDNQGGQVAARRKTRLDLVVGINGTGKTTWLREQVVARAPKALVLTPDEAEWRELPKVERASEIYALRGAARYVCDDPTHIDDDIARISRSFHGGALVLDDARAYLGCMTGRSTNYMYIRRRQYGVDIYLVAHGLRQVPVQAFTYASFLHLFYTSENFSQRKRDLDPDAWRRIEGAKAELARAVAGGDKHAVAHLKLDQSL